MAIGAPAAIPEDIGASLDVLVFDFPYLEALRKVEMVVLTGWFLPQFLRLLFPCFEGIKSLAFSVEFPNHTTNTCRLWNALMPVKDTLGHLCILCFRKRQSLNMAHII